MIIDGVKWACDACIRGHRVSGCTHSDRELKQIAKKGRPVSQCPHCRHLRKSRSAHVKCDCGEKHGKDQAAKKVGAGGCCTSNSMVKGESKPSSFCTCCHGGRCTCALKKDSPLLDTVPEFPPPRERKSSFGRSRLQTTQSESSLTTFANGHHKPTHKSHHGVSPYTIAGHADHHRPSFLDDDDLPPPVAPKHRRMKSVSDKSSLDLVSLTRAYGTGNHFLGLEHGIELTPRQPTAVQQGSSRAHSGLSVNTNQAQFSLHENFSQDFLQSADSDVHQFSAGLQPSAGWPSFQHFELDWTYPGLTSSSSVDENDEQSLPTNDAAHSLTGTGPLPSEASDLGDDSYRISAHSSFIGLPQLLGGNRLEDYILDFVHTGTRMETKSNLERYLSDTSPQQPVYLDVNLNPALPAESGFDGDSSLFSPTYLNQQPPHGSTDTLDILASNIHSPADTSVLINVPTPLSPEDEGSVWMRKFSNASTYQSPLEQNWQAPSQSQSPR